MRYGSSTDGDGHRQFVVIYTKGLEFTELCGNWPVLPIVLLKQPNDHVIAVWAFSVRTTAKELAQIRLFLVLLLRGRSLAFSNLPMPLKLLATSASGAQEMYEPAHFLTLLRRAAEEAELRLDPAGVRQILAATKLAFRLEAAAVTFRRAGQEDDAKESIVWANVLRDATFLRNWGGAGDVRAAISLAQEAEALASRQRA